MVRHALVLLALSFVVMPVVQAQPAPAPGFVALPVVQAPPVQTAENFVGGYYGWIPDYSGVYLGNGSWSSLNYMFGGIAGPSWLPYGGARRLPVTYRAILVYPARAEPIVVVDSSLHLDEKPVKADAVPATLIIHAPALARLSVNGTAMQLANPVRFFRTLPLEPNKDVRYTVTAEMFVGGENRTVTQEVSVRAGERKEVVVDFVKATVAK